MRNLDFSSWPAMALSFVGLALVTLVGVAIRLAVMQSVQARRDRENRRINERLRTLIAAYKALGGSFTGSLIVNPSHKRDLKDAEEVPGAERARRVRDAVEAALSDIILLGTEDQVALAARAASQLVAGRTVETAELSARPSTSPPSRRASRSPARAPRGSSSRPARKAAVETKARAAAGWAVWAETWAVARWASTSARREMRPARTGLNIHETRPPVAAGHRLTQITEVMTSDRMRRPDGSGIAAHPSLFGGAIQTPGLRSPAPGRRPGDYSASSSRRSRGGPACIRRSEDDESNRR